MFKRYLMILCGLLAGCQALSAPNVPATLQAENRGVIAEATMIAATAEAREAQTAATAAAAMTRIVEMQSVNQQLLVTVRAGDPVDQMRGVVANTIATPVGLEAGRRWFVKTGTSSVVRASDGCVEDPRLRFPTTVSAIYATVRAFNIEAGTQMSALWTYEGNEVQRDSWTLPSNYADICMWFDINSQQVEFTPGNWAVRLFADGFQLEDAMSFVIFDPMSGG